MFVVRLIFLLTQAVTTDDKIKEKYGLYNI